MNSIGPADMAGEKLMFGGVANRCTVWLNGRMLGGHEGMFGGPDFDIAGKLQERNTLVLRLDPVPFEIDKGRAFNPDSNDSWKRTVVFNNVYGWHYSNLQSLGIWRSVRIQGRAAVALVDPFMRAVDAHAGIAELALQFEGPAAGWGGTLKATIAPENFAGQTYSFSKRSRIKRGKSQAKSTLSDSRAQTVVAGGYGRSTFVPGHAFVHAGRWRP